MDDVTDLSRVGNWGRWGAEDERGMLNEITHDHVRDAAALVRRGKTYSLALPIRSSGVPMIPYRGTPMRLTLQNQADDDFGDPDVGANEDMLMLPSHNGTHMDALCHVHADGLLYNNVAMGAMKTLGGARRGAIDKVGSIVGRAILLDICGLHGVDVLESGYFVTSADLEMAAQRQSVQLRAGDIMLVRTGWLGRYMAAGARGSMMTQPGLGLDSCTLIRDIDIAVVGADNSAIEAMPFDQGKLLGVHVELLVKLGVHLLEHLVLDEMAADEAWESLFVVAPLPVVGATGSPINPIAIT
ncbi:MAG TPA: cyclase family protein [Ilumatobacteraceae bacterium]|jgi:kynurenine formamidase